MRNDIRYMVILRGINTSDLAMCFSSPENASKAISALLLQFPKSAKIYHLLPQKWIIKDGNQSISIQLKQAANIEYRLILSKNNVDIQRRRFTRRSNACFFVEDFFRSHNLKLSENDSKVGIWKIAPNAGDFANHKFTLKLIEFTQNDQNNPRNIQIDRTYLAANLLYVLKHYIVRKHSTVTHLDSANSKKRIKSSKSQPILPLVAIIGVVAIIVLALCLADWQEIKDKQIASTYKPDERTTEIINMLPLTEKGRIILYATHPILENSSDYNRSCGQLNTQDTYVSGCYFPKDDEADESIHLYYINETSISENGIYYNYKNSMATTLLHETLHAAYERLSEKEQNESCGHLKIMREAISDLDSEMELYSNDICSELFARYGSTYGLNIHNALGSEPFVVYSQLSYTEQKAADYLKEIYANYYNATPSLHDLWFDNELAISTLNSRMEYYYKLLDSQGAEVERLKNAYYAWPTYRNRNNANAAINTYNSYVETYNANLKTLLKIAKAKNSKYDKYGDTYYYNSSL